MGSYAPGGRRRAVFDPIQDLAILLVSVPLLAIATLFLLAALAFVGMFFLADEGDEP